MGWGRAGARLGQAALARDGAGGLAQGCAHGALQQRAKDMPVGDDALVAAHLPADALQHLLHQGRHERLACSAHMLQTSQGCFRIQQMRWLQCCRDTIRLLCGPSLGR